MNAQELVDSLIRRGIARSTQLRPGASRSVVVGGVELAVAERRDERNLRARWRERVGNSGTPYVLIADQPGVEGSLVSLGPNDADGPIRLVRGSALAEVLGGASRLNTLEAVRFVGSEMERLDQTDIAGVKLKRLLTVHTLDVRLREDDVRWSEAGQLVQPVIDFEDWRSVLSSLGYQLERRPHRGWLARYDGRPIAVVHPKARVF